MVVSMKSVDEEPGMGKKDRLPIQAVPVQSINVGVRDKLYQLTDSTAGNTQQTNFNIITSAHGHQHATLEV